MKIAKTIAISIFLFTQLYAQSTIAITTELEFLNVEQVPAKRIPKKIERMEFAFQYNPTPILYFGYRLSEEKFKVIGKITEDVEYFNQAKSSAYFANDTLYVWTQQPFRASEINYKFLWSKKTFQFINSYWYDPSEEAIMLAEKALKEGKIAEAIQYYYTVQYPSSYMNEDMVGFTILSRANELGVHASNEHRYKEAVQYMDDAMGYYTLEEFGNAPDDETISLSFEDHYVPEYKDSFGLWMANYGYFLYKADSLERSIGQNTWLTKTYPELSGPYLQLGDALFDLKRNKEARPVYLRYIQLMKEKGKEKNIPQRVHDRVK